MAYSFVTYTGDGSTDTFAVPFAYIAKSHVKVYVDGVLQTVTTHYTWPTAASIQFVSAPALDAVVRFERESSRASRLVNFSDAAQMTAADMNKALKQDFFMSQEAFDAVDNSIALDTDDKYEANSKVIKNVADPVSAQDAATKAYGDANWGGSAAAAAAASAAAAATAETNAETAETNAEAAQAAAEAAQAAAEAAQYAAETVYDNFDDRYLGAKASDPSLDNDGNALIDGALYFNTTTNRMMVYDLGTTTWLTVVASSTAGKQSIWIPAGAMVAQITNGAAAGLGETGNGVMFQSYLFDQSTQEAVQFQLALPKQWDEGTVTAQFFWTFAASSGGVVWEMQAVAISDGDPTDGTFGTAQSVADTAGTAGFLHVTAETPAITIAGSPAVGDLVVFRVRRVPGDASDTLAADVYLLGIKLFITTNADTDA